MIDVFVRFAPQTPLRLHLAAAVFARWMEEPDIQLHTIWMQGTFPAFSESSKDLPCICEVELSKEDFAWGSRQYAERRSYGDCYILADDDHLILGTDWVKRLVEASNRHPEFSILGARSVILSERVDPQTHGGATEWDGIIKHWCVGTPCLIRKAAIPYGALMGKASQQDVIIGEAMKDRNLGFVTGLDYLHLGYGHSQVEPLLWRRY